MKTKLISILIFLILPGITGARESILSFHSDIQIMKNASMLVTETIKVNAEHVNIRRGIYRDIPIRYKDRLGHSYKVGFRLVSVERNGVTEPYHTERLANGIRIYIGDKNTFIKKSEHEYRITYETNRQLGFYQEHDELYWNVTGNGWRFPILYASADVTLPGYMDTGSIKVAGYTGVYGSREKAVQIDTPQTNRIHFESTRRLNPSEGLTIIAGWPKGHVDKPSIISSVNYFLDDNPNALPGLIGMFLVFSFYYLIWHGIGRDRLSPVRFPIYKPPRNFSPAACRYLLNMEYDNKTAATAIVSLATKGYLKIHKNVNNTYELEKRRLADKKDMAAGEFAIFSRLFNNINYLPLNNDFYETISAAMHEHEDSLKKNYHKVYFLTNSGWIILGGVISVLTLLFFFSRTENLLDSAKINSAGFIVVIALLILSPLIRKYISKAIPNSKIIKLPLNTVIIAIGVYIILPISLLFTLVVSLIVSMNFIFYELLKTPTRAGRPVIEKLYGLKHYLEVAEADELNTMHTPEKTPETFTYFFPYAMALDVENAWAEKFASVLIPALHGTDSDSSLDWSRQIDLSDSEAFCSSFTDSISSSSIAPGSDSGFSDGGGFSGGGGGGGGGGGW